MGPPCPRRCPASLPCHTSSRRRGSGMTRRRSRRITTFRRRRKVPRPKCRVRKWPSRRWTPRHRLARRRPRRRRLMATLWICWSVFRAGGTCYRQLLRGFMPRRELRQRLGRRNGREVEIWQNALSATHRQSSRVSAIIRFVPSAATRLPMYLGPARTGSATLRCLRMALISSCKRVRSQTVFQDGLRARIDKGFTQKNKEIEKGYAPRNKIQNTSRRQFYFQLTYVQLRC
ncbi:unnamed protein product [Chondrus crispus]|uniref:Uncharacterized protein n=1 Tax=Chondrus crispus TaxID=2769 RepID=R7QI59_CHOCR|nr:unnamed protein product [Chondrus crispus]CDF37759.1 unnamed protein product [Chondrus crispus]|eukprot:XP_005717630.1 unnamed protein product [Chondrus crispus]